MKKGQTVLALDGSHWKKRNFEKILRTLAQNPHLKLIVINPDEKMPEQALSGQTVMNSPSSAETAEALSQARGFIGSKNDVFSIAYMLKVPSLITAGPHSRGLPLPGELLQIRPGQLPFEISDQELAIFLQKIF